MKRFLIIICLVVMFSLTVIFLLFRNQRIQSQVLDEKRSIEFVSVYVNKIQINPEWTEHMRTDWVSAKPSEDSALDSMAVEYGMEAADVDDFCNHYKDYAILDIQGKIRNASKVTIDSFSYSFTVPPDGDGIWLNSDTLFFVENIDVEPGRLIPFCGKAIIDLERHSEDEYILLLKRCGLNMRFRYETADQQEHEGLTSFVFN